MNLATNIPTVTVEREINATPDELFDAWLDSRSLAIWMPPGGTAETIVHADPTVGGRFEISMNGPFGTHVHRGTYFTIDRPQGPAAGTRRASPRPTSGSSCRASSVHWRQ